MLRRVGSPRIRAPGRNEDILRWNLCPSPLLASRPLNSGPYKVGISLGVSCREKEKAEAWCPLEENGMSQRDVTQLGIFSDHFARDTRTKATGAGWVRPLLPGLLSCAYL